MEKINKASGLISVTVIYALPRQQWVRSLRCPENTSIRTALELASVFKSFPELDVSCVGVHGVVRELDFLLSNFDRVEIYRPLTLSPIEMRKLRAKKQK